MEKPAETKERVFSFEAAEGCVMLVHKTPGVTNCTCDCEMTSAEAGIKGLSLMTVNLAKALRMSTEEVVCRLTVTLFAPDDPQQFTEEKE